MATGEKESCLQLFHVSSGLLRHRHQNGIRNARERLREILQRIKWRNQEQAGGGFGSHCRSDTCARRVGRRSPREESLLTVVQLEKVLAGQCRASKQRVPIGRSHVGQECPPPKSLRCSCISWKQLQETRSWCEGHGGDRGIQLEVVGYLCFLQVLLKGDGRASAP